MTIFILELRLHVCIKTNYFWEKLHICTKVTAIYTVVGTIWFLFIYEDDGLGIAEEHLEHVFKPFYTTKKNRGSTGLGMHVIYNTVVQVLRGRLELDSSIGKGVELRIIIPKLEIEEYIE